MANEDKKTLEEQIKKALSKVNDPELNQDIVSLGMVKDVSIGEEQISVNVELTTPACPLKDVIGKDIRNAVGKVAPGREVVVDFGARVRAKKSSKGKEIVLPEVKHIILVASGKGGVGKSTVATNIAMALKQEGAEVGLCDGDLYGPSIPTMMGVHDEPQPGVQKKIAPIVAHGMKMMSIGFFTTPEVAVMWRGPMLHAAIKQFTEDVDWGKLDYLVFDLPPGTGDVQLSIAQLLNVSGAVIVSTPQDVALNDVIRARSMFEKLQIPVLGLVENMSYFICDECGKRHEIFAHGGAEKAAQSMDIPFLGRVPMEAGVCEAGDFGEPMVVRHPDSESAKAFFQIARNLAANIAVSTHKEPDEDNVIPIRS